MKNKIAFIVVATLVVISFILAGCAKPAPAPVPAPVPAPAPTPTPAPAPKPAPPEVRTIKFGTAWPLSQPSNQAIKWAFDQITEQTKGQVKFETYWAGSVVAAKEEMSSVQSGTLDMSTAHQLYYPAVFPMTFWSWCVAFVPTDAVHYVKIQKKLLEEFPEIQKEVSSIPNSKVFYDSAMGSYNWIGFFPLKDIHKDLQGVKIIVSGEWNPKWFEALGAQTIPTTTPEFFGKLQTHMAEGSGSAPLTNIINLKLYESGTNYVTLIGHGSRCGGWHFMNMDTWNSLSPDQQKLFDEMMWQAALKSGEIANQIDVDSTKVLQEAGVIINTMPTEQRAEWAKIIKPVVLAWVKTLEDQGKPAARMLKRIQEIAAELGSPFPYPYID